MNVERNRTMPAYGLILSCQLDEQVVITVPAGSDPTRIVFTLVDWRKGKARCGFKAAEHVAINRSNVQQQIDDGITRGRSAADGAAPNGNPAPVPVAGEGK